MVVWEWEDGGEGRLGYKGGIRKLLRKWKYPLF